MFSFYIATASVQQSSFIFIYVYLLVCLFILFNVGRDSLKTYYFSINVTNDVSNDAEVKWKGISGDEELIVWKNSVMMKEMAFTSAYQPQNFTLRAFERGTANLLLLNNAEFIEVSPSLSKHIINIRITKGTTCYFPYAFLYFFLKCIAYCTLCL